MKPTTVTIPARPGKCPACEQKRQDAQRRQRLSDVDKQLDDFAMMRRITTYRHTCKSQTGPSWPMQIS